MAFFSALKHLFSHHKKDKNSIHSSKKKKSSNKLLNNSPHIKSKSTILASDSPTSSTKHSLSSRDGHSFQFKDGRRYNADADIAYVLPNDDDEADRVHQQHWILRYALQCNYHAPVTDQLEEGIVVLDSGCGPATWTFEMGEQYPRSTFHGIDASCVFPEDIKPANVEFVIGNIAKDIPYPNNTFDYVHQRLLVLGLTNNDWENPDLQDLCNMGPLLRQLQYTMSDMLNSRGMPPKISNELESRLVKAGFVNEVVKVTPLDLNHGGKAGELLWDDYKHGHMNIRPIMAKINADWEELEAYELHIDDCASEAANHKTCLNWYTCYAQKPLDQSP